MDGMSNSDLKESIKVYCRVRPISDPSESSIRVISDSQIQLSPPMSAVVLRNGPSKEVIHTFREVFDETADQNFLFSRVGLPQVKNVLSGQNGVLFTYGVTGSGKTYTLSGPPQNPGIMPRCLDVLFNSISTCQAHRYTFKPDRLNGFDIQSEADVEMDIEQALLNKVSTAKNIKLHGNAARAMASERDMASGPRSTNQKVDVNEDNCFSVFITYIEIYNNSVFDLLEDVFDDGVRAKPLQTKIIREDCQRNMFVHGVTELEVCSTEEAFEAYYKGQKRRKMAQTNLNAESSRSHSVFTIRIVQAPLDQSGRGVVQDKNQMSVSQLSLVDLAGSERTNRTKNTGRRLKEAGNINNSLLTLRICLELLRENQNGGNKMIPYRDSRLTHLFKGFFEGDGSVIMIICVNPHVEDYDETVHVLRFAEMSQEVQVPATPAKNICFTPGRRKALEAFELRSKEFQEMLNERIAGGDCGARAQTVLASDSFFSNLPDIRLFDVNDDEAFLNLNRLFDEEVKAMNSYAEELKKSANSLKDIMIKNERDAFMAIQEAKACKSLVESTDLKRQAAENKLIQNTEQLMTIKRKLDDAETEKRKLKEQINEKNVLLGQRAMERERFKEKFSSKIIQTEEKLNREFERRLRSQKAVLESQLKEKENKLKVVKRIINNAQPTRPHKFARLDSKSAESLASGYGTPNIASSVESIPQVASAPPSASVQGSSVGPSNLNGFGQHANLQPPRPTARKGGVAVSNRRHRRSRSAGNEIWLEHRPGNSVPLNTLMQPTMTKRKSITQLTDAKDVTEKTSKYCLLTQNQDSDGDLETRLYKADVIPTAGGGAQVLFNDVEVLRQESPTVSPSRKRPADIRREIEAACTRSAESKRAYSKY